MVRIIGRVRGGYDENTIATKRAFVELQGETDLIVRGFENEARKVTGALEDKAAKFHKTFGMEASNEEVFEYLICDLEDCLFRDR